MSKENEARLKCPECGSEVSLWTDLHGAAQAACTFPSCDWDTFDMEVDL